MSVQRQLHKFGGSSLANPECYLRVADILKEYSARMIWWWYPPRGRPLIA